MHVCENDANLIWKRILGNEFSIGTPLLRHLYVSQVDVSTWGGAASVEEHANMPAVFQKMAPTKNVHMHKRRDQNTIARFIRRIPPMFAVNAS